MKTLVQSLFLFSVLILITGCNFPLIPAKKAGLTVSASPNAGIFLNGEHIGSTPYVDNKLKPGEYSLKIMPESGVGQPWEARIILNPGIMTVISRQLGENQDTSSGFMLNLEKIKDNRKSSIQVVTVPDKSVVSIDGESKGFSPLSIESITPGDHVLIASAPGYIDQTINANIKEGYLLSASIQLSRSMINMESSESTRSSENKTDLNNESGEEVLDMPNSSPAVSPSTMPKQISDIKPPYIIVQNTPTGYLNVRESPSTSGNNIISKINPGEMYKYIDKNNSGWYQIDLSNNQTGWISSKYVKLIEK